MAVILLLRFAVFAAGSLASPLGSGAAAFVAAVRAAEAVVVLEGLEGDGRSGAFAAVVEVDFWIEFVEVPFEREEGRSSLGERGFVMGFGEVGMALLRRSALGVVSREPALTPGRGSFSASRGAGRPEKVLGRPLGRREPGPTRSSLDTPFRRRPFRAA